MAKKLVNGMFSSISDADLATMAMRIAIEADGGITDLSEDQQSLASFPEENNAASSEIADNSEQ